MTAVTIGSKVPDNDQCIPPEAPLQPTMRRACQSKPEFVFWPKKETSWYRKDNKWQRSSEKVTGEQLSSLFLMKNEERREPILVSNRQGTDFSTISTDK